jgi:REP element-mobilizing transposase RayT
VTYGAIALGEEAAMELLGFVFMPEHVHLPVYPRSPNPSISRYLARPKQPFSVARYAADSPSPVTSLAREFR